MAAATGEGWVELAGATLVMLQSEAGQVIVTGLPSAASAGTSSWWLLRLQRGKPGGCCVSAALWVGGC